MNIQRPKSVQDRPRDAKRVFRGVLFDVYQWKQQLFDESHATFEQLSRADSVTVVPVTTDGKIIVTKQEQPGRASFVSPPGGIIDPGEEPLTAVKRELLEETGYTAESYELWYTMQPIGKIDWVIYTFIARGCTKNAEPNLDAGEKIKTSLVSFDEFLQLALEDDFRDTEMTLALLKAKEKGQLGELKEKFLG